MPRRYAMGNALAALSGALSWPPVNPPTFGAVTNGNGHDGSSLELAAAQLRALNVDTSGGTDACWLFRGALHKSGHARVSIGGCYVSLGRYAWKLVHGEPPRRVRVWRTCAGGARCCRPSHLS